MSRAPRRPDVERELNGLTVLAFAFHLGGTVTRGIAAGRAGAGSGAGASLVAIALVEQQLRA